MVESIGANTLVNSEAVTSTNSLSQLGEDFERFLTLLTAQIQYQDPLEPMDSSQFVTQLAQLSQVEQAVATNSNLESLGASLNALVSSAGADLIGREVTVSSSQFALEAGATDAMYRVEGQAASVRAQIVDGNGFAVRSLNDLPFADGVVQDFAWDGLSDDGSAVLDGEYFLTVTAVDSQGNDLPVNTYRKARVEEVIFTGGANYFNLDSGQQVGSDAILSAS